MVLHTHTHTQVLAWQRREANTMATGGIVASGWLDSGGGGGARDGGRTNDGGQLIQHMACMCIQLSV